MTDWDVAVVGRSFGGLSAALTLGRARRSVLVIGDGGPRNGDAAHSHGLLTRDHTPPGDLIALAETDLDRYEGVHLERGHVTDLSVHSGHVDLRFDDRSTSASAVVLATGVNDDPLAIPGLAEHWGRGVYTCPFCDGYEHAGEPWGLVGREVMAPQVLTLTNWASSLTVFHPDDDGGVAATLAEAGLEDVTIDRRPIRRIRGDGERVRSIEMHGGQELSVGAVFVSPSHTPNSQLAQRIGCAVDQHGYIEVDGTGATNTDRVYAVGDVTRFGPHQVVHSISDGVRAGCAITRRLVTDERRR